MPIKKCVDIKKTVDKKEINAAFNEGSSALYLIIQMICPECNKLVRVSLLVSGDK